MREKAVRCFVHLNRPARWPRPDPVFCCQRCAAQYALEQIGEECWVWNPETANWDQKEVERESGEEDSP